MTDKIVNIPEGQWVDFINILYASIEHIAHTENNRGIMMTLRQIVGDSFHKGEVLVVDGKIVPRDYFKNDKRTSILSNKERSST